MNVARFLHREGMIDSVRAPNMTFPYHNSQGEHVASILRWNTSGEKAIRPIKLDSDGRWRSGQMPSPWYLYRLPELCTSDGRIWIVEGEKSADALARIGLIATTSPHGAKSPEKANWKPLAGRDVAIWPDNDEPGEVYAAKVAGILQKLNPPAIVRIVRPEGLPPKGDAADWSEQRDAVLPEDLAAELEAMAEATPVAPPCEIPLQPYEKPSERQRLTPGTLVRACDRDNFGSVVRDDGTSITVHFDSPNGNTADVEFDPSQLLLANGAPVDPTSQPIILPVSVASLVFNFPGLRKPVIDGLLRRGEVGNIIAKSKVGKSWLTYTIALSVATGGRLFDRFDCAAGRVLLIDNELHPEVLAQRIPAVAESWGIPLADLAGSLDVIPLRGRLTDINGLFATLQAIGKDKYQLIILDAMYRALPAGTNENDNAAIAQIYNTLDSYAAMTGAAFLIVHHASKGDQSGKDVTDVGSGAGSQSRAADTHVILRPHEQDNTVVCEAAVRSWKPVEPFCLRWEFPRWVSAAEADPAALKQPATRTDERQSAKDREGFEAIVEALRDHGAMTASKLRKVTGLSFDRANRLIQLMRSDGRIIESQVVMRGNSTEEYTLAGYLRSA